MTGKDPCDESSVAGQDRARDSGANGNSRLLLDHDAAPEIGILRVVVIVIAARARVGESERRF